MSIRLIVSVLLSIVIAWNLAGFRPAAPVFVPEQDQDEKQDEAESEEKEEEKGKELTLERLFPEKSFFGPSASDMAFSHDGRYGAWLYRPYIERRHGSDLWIIDTQSSEVKRITNVVVMSEFQEDARTVKKDREEKAKKEGIGQTQKDGEDGEGEGEEVEEGEQEEEDEGEAEQMPPAADIVSGEWSGKLTGGQDLGLPPDGLPFTLTLQLHTDNSVSGTLSTAMTTVQSTEGRFDPEKKEITCTFVDAESGTAASMTAAITDEAMTGSIEIQSMGVTLQLTATRTKAGAGDGEPRQEQDGEKEQDDDEEQDEEQDEENEQEDGEKEEIILGNWVSEKDADDERAPRYSGIQSFEWSPVAKEMIFISQGDLYRLNMEDGSIVRLTKTRVYERGVQYLPDGSGYTYMNDGRGVIKVCFGSHLIEQLDPALPAGEEMRGYELSPDGTRMVFLTGKSLGEAPSRTVNIMTFRNRFAEVREVPRHVSDDPLAKEETSIYLYDMRNPLTEDVMLGKVYTHTSTGPRDILQVPEWSPDSERIAFAVYSQATGLVDIYEATFPKREEAKDEEVAEPQAEVETGEGGDDDGIPPQERRGRRGGDGEQEGGSAEEEENEFAPAALVYRFFHHGGPNTPVMIHPYYLPDSRRMVFLTEQSGFRQLHILDPIYESLTQITHGQFEVYPFDISKDHRFMFATATKEHPTREDVYRIDLESGEMVRLSREDGVYGTVAVCNDGSKALANHATYGQLRELQYIDATKGEQRELTESHPDEARELTEPRPEFFTYKNRLGQEIHGTLFRPDGWTAEDKRPLLIYVYGGPLGTSKQVVDGSYGAPNYFFAYYMAKKHGYVTCTIDPRGVSGYGGLFEKSNFERVGKPQTEDLVDGVKWFVENQGVDPKRVGIHGWSFGGFQTQMCMYTEPDVFQVGIAGAGPTEWENYNSWYSQGTIGKTGEGTADLKKYSLLPLAKNLKGKLLLIHGMEDSNVLYQDTVRVYRELLAAGKETNVELFLDPTGGHGLGGDIKTINRFRKYEDFLLQHLGRGEVPEEDATEVGEDSEDGAPAQIDDKGDDDLSN